MSQHPPERFFFQRSYRFIANKPTLILKRGQNRRTGRLSGRIGRLHAPETNGEYPNLISGFDQQRVVLTTPHTAIPY